MKDALRNYDIIKYCSSFEMPNVKFVLNSFKVARDIRRVNDCPDY